MAFELGWERDLRDPLTDGLAGFHQALDVVDIELAQQLVNPLIKAIVTQKIPIGLGGGGESPGHTHAGGRKVADHFPEGGVLAPNPVDVAHAELFKPDYMFIQGYPLKPS